jgi:hypothetical protein
MLLLNKKILYGIIVIVVLGALLFAYQWYKTHPNDDVMIPTDKEMLIANDVGLRFSYPVGDNGLTLIEPPFENQAFMKAYILIPSVDYDDYQKSPEGREAPAAISVFVYELGDDEAITGSSTEDRPNRITRLQNWAKDNSTITSFNSAKGTPDIIELDGVKTLHYKADGLYQQDIYLASYHNNVYMFVSQYNAETDITYMAFQELIASVGLD